MTFDFILFNLYTNKTNLLLFQYLPLTFACHIQFILRFPTVHIMKYICELETLPLHVIKSALIDLRVGHFCREVIGDKFEILETSQRSGTISE